MIKCPRCNFRQEKSPECECCGLIFEEFMNSARSSKTGYPKRSALFVIIFVLSAALLASYWFISLRHKSSDKPTTVESSSASGQRTKENDLRTIGKELSGDAGIIKSLTDGSTKGSIIAMLFFSVIGIGFFSYGKKSQQLLMVVCGIALMGYPYFIDGTVLIVLIGVGLSALPFVLGRK